VTTQPFLPTTDKAVRHEHWLIRSLLNYGEETGMLEGFRHIQQNS